MAGFPPETNHPAHGERCKLRLVKHREGHAPTEFHCDGCKINGKGTRYVSRDQQLALHTACALAKPTLNHRLVKGIMNLRHAPKGGEALICYACFGGVHGFHYYGTETTDRGEYPKLHPRCANLPFSFNLPGDGGLTFKFELLPEVKHNCTGCKCIDWYYRPWCYRSKNNTNQHVYLHVKCLMEIVESPGGEEEIKRLMAVLQKRALKNARRDEIVCKVLVGLVRGVVKVLMGDPTAILEVVSAIMS